MQYTTAAWVLIAEESSQWAVQYSFMNHVLIGNSRGMHVPLLHNTEQH